MTANATSHGALGDDPEWNEYFKQGIKTGAFIQSAEHTSGQFNGTLIGQNHKGGYQGYFDWLNEQSLNIWENGMTDLRDHTQFDGVVRTRDELRWIE